MTTRIPPLAVQLDVTIEQGAHFSARFLWKDSNGDPVDLTGYTARWPMRSKNDDELLLEPTTTNSQIVLGLVGDPDTDPAAYNIAVDVDEDDTEALTPTDFRHNLEMIPSTGETRRLAQGSGTVSAEVASS